MADSADPQQLLTALTTEHFTLQGARAQTASESASRATLFVMALSSTLVALGFLGQGSEYDDTFEIFALVALPTVYLLGIFSFVRIVECSAEDFRYGVAINRIRHYYQEIAGDEARLFLLSGHDDGHGVFANAAVPAEGRKQLFTFATVVAVIDSVVAGSAVAIGCAQAKAPVGVSAVLGALVGLVSLTLLLWYAGRLLEQRTATESIFPTPEGSL